MLRSVSSLETRGVLITKRRRLEFAADVCFSVWKGSPSTSLVSIATNKVPPSFHFPHAALTRRQQLVTDVLQANNVNPAVSTLVQVSSSTP
jgi:hypothetical protein